MFTLGKRSRERLYGVHSDLVLIIGRAIQLTPIDFTVLEGYRDAERQEMLYRTGASQTMESRHLTGHAVDLGAYVGGRVAWDWPLYDRIAAAVKQAGSVLDIPIEWGGDWTSFRDGPHFQLPRTTHP